MRRLKRGYDNPPPRIGGASAWKGIDMAERAVWLEHLAESEIAEIDAAVHAFKRSGADFRSICVESFALPTLGVRLKRVLRDLLHGRGFVQLRGFPVDRYSIEDVAAAYLGIGAHLGSFRSQNAAGHLLGHVQDIGADIRQPNIRYYQTNKALEYHTDSCDIVGLMCLRTSRSGGASRIVSSVSLYNELMAHRPDLAEMLFHAFPTDRRGEIPEGERPWFDIPVFNWYDGKLTTIYVGQYIHSAQSNFPQARRLTAIELEALDMLDQLSNDPALSLEIAFNPGDMQFLHNHQVLHSRTEFEDWPEPERKRHLLRLWLSPKEGRALPACFEARYGSLVPGARGGIITKGTQLNFALAAV
jgi:hypothetical protein